MPAERRPITAESPTQAATAESLGSAVSQTEQQTQQDAEFAASPEPATDPKPEAASSLGRPQMLVYDGDCRFCVSRARWFQRRVGKSSRLGKASGTAASKTSAAVAWQDLNLAEVGIAEDVVAREAVWVDKEGRQFTGHDAIAKSFIHIGGLWGIAGRLLRVPPISWIARLVYRIVAANRHRIPSKGDEQR